MFEHLPIMPEEVLENLAIQPGSIVADITAGGGGHLRLLAEAVGPTGLVIALDKDARAHELDAAGGVAKEFKQVKLFKATFSELPRILAEQKIKNLNALLCDLGVSSPQLDTDERGFSFRHDGPLDMRMDQEAYPSAYELIRQTSETDLANLIYKYGEERQSRRIAKAIKYEKNLPDSTLGLANIIMRAYAGPRGKIHPATRTFQALRIAVNSELGELESLLSNLDKLMAPNGRVAFISFHSLEDRPIKHYFKQHPESWRVLHKKPIIASELELSQNKRATCAKLRIAERINI
ncbi:MAG: 16S rRNA (cytosine(1402)-N(4))-methyltransferase RsmH [Myxococcaceae bacterium]